MRDIKFRAWNEETKAMVDLEKITPLALSDSMNTQLSIMGGGGVFVPFLPNFKIMQFTGLKDKNGNELYEGDIVVIKGHDGDSQEHSDWLNSLNAAKSLFDKIPIIELKRDVVTMSRFPTFWLENEKFGYEGEELQESEEWEKIGNIHENPELLETS